MICQTPFQLVLIEMFTLLQESLVNSSYKFVSCAVGLANRVRAALGPIMPGPSRNVDATTLPNAIRSKGEKENHVRKRCLWKKIIFQQS